MSFCKDSVALIIVIISMVFLIVSVKTDFTNIPRGYVSLNQTMNVTFPVLNGQFHITLSAILKNANNRRIWLILSEYSNERLVKSWNATRKDSRNVTLFGLNENIKINLGEYLKICFQGNYDPLKLMYISSGRITFTKNETRRIPSTEPTIETTTTQNAASNKLKDILIPIVIVLPIIIGILILILYCIHKKKTSEEPSKECENVPLSALNSV